MKIKLLPLLLLLSLFSSCSRETAPPWAVNLVAQVGGEKLVDRIFEKAESPIDLPPLPKVEVNARSSSFGSEYESSEVQITGRSDLDLKYVEELYAAVKKTQISEKEASAWLNTLSQGGSREGVYHGIIRDASYAAAEGSDDSASGELVTFALMYMEKYLGQTMEKSELQKVNFYLLKRTIVDRSLDIVDAFKEDKSARVDWYAVLSQELAEKFETVLKGDLRSNKDPLAHQAWGRAVPTQQLKSELIIKLHLVMNSLH